MLHDPDLLSFVAQVCRLQDGLRWSRDGDRYFYRVALDGFSQLLYFRRHGRREHHGLSFFREQLLDFHDILVKTHIEHSVGFVEDKIFHP